VVCADPDLLAAGAGGVATAHVGSDVATVAQLAARVAKRLPLRRLVPLALWVTPAGAGAEPYELSDARLGQGSVASSRCTTAHPLYTRFTKHFGASISEATMRPNPSLGGLEPGTRVEARRRTGSPSGFALAAAIRSRRWAEAAALVAPVCPTDENSPAPTILSRH
jgi:hypothetical protein